MKEPHKPRRKKVRLHKPPDELVAALNMPPHKRRRAYNVIRRDSIRDSLRNGWPGPKKDTSSLP